MNTTREEALHLARGVLRGVQEVRGEVDVAIAPPLPWLVPVEAALGRATRVQLAAQDADPGLFGPRTGDVSIGMLTPHIQYLILGHSERRLSGQESHDSLSAKLLDAVRRGITPVLCVGEFVPLYEAKRRRGRPTRLEAASNVFMQLRRALRGAKESDLGKLVICYEPVWAISTSKTGGPANRSADPVYANLMARKLRRSFARLGGTRRAKKLRILYGGSVNPKNVASYAHQPHIDGALVGKASLESADFVEVVRAFAV